MYKFTYFLWQEVKRKSFIETGKAYRSKPIAGPTRILSFRFPAEKDTRRIGSGRYPLKMHTAYYTLDVTDQDSESPEMACRIISCALAGRPATSKDIYHLVPACLLYVVPLENCHHAHQVSLRELQL